MATDLSTTLPAFAAFSGITAHLLLYRHGEWDVNAPKLVVIYIIILLVAVALERAANNSGLELGPKPCAAQAMGYHLLGLYGSMAFYRGFMHRLSRFPGPFLARLSNFYVTALSARKLHLYEETEKLHKKFGDYVRLGPTELSIADPDAVKALYGPQAKVSKGPWYTVLEPRVSLQMVRNKQEHARRRKVWDQGFSSRALRDYAPRVSHYTELLIQNIHSELGRPMDVSRWFNYYSFDVMGDLSFGKSFDMLVDGKDAYILKQMHADMKNVGLFSHLTWLFPFFKRIPVLNTNYLKFWSWVDKHVEERIQNSPDRPDVFSWILENYEQHPKTKQNTLDLHGDAYLIIVAGSDTTAATLTNMFFHLAFDRTLCDNLQAELDALPDLSYDSLRGAKLLEAVINETLRLHPAVPSGTQRKSPPEGMTIGNTYIPGDVIVCVPVHTLFRDERVFVRPNEFLPERWTTHPELVKDPSVFIPFSSGPYSCVGKQLALMELRRVTAEILTRYDTAFDGKQTVPAFWDGKRDTFTLVTAPLWLVFKEREMRV
ncbi:Cytochrome P450 [Penicillium pulvis]|uniref:Cytochrome P450 n=1 Tax=Penicillium pulvis TaxID=1562058 RepID=UPI002546DD81|nr:Cytochrome P450 [Penicillium pulvis]KAJ5805507.1 Cytochrome P450 [Penicillium pulvis]